MFLDETMIELSYDDLPESLTPIYLKVVGTDTDQPGTRDLLLVTHSNYESILCRFRDRGEESQNFHTYAPCI